MTARPASAPTFRVTEAQVQRGIIGFLKRTGWSVWRVGQYNARRTQDAGVPDLIAMHDVLGHVYIECKRPGGRQSPGQKAFQIAATRANTAYLLAESVDAVVAYTQERAQHFTLMNRRPA